MKIIFTFYVDMVNFVDYGQGLCKSAQIKPDLMPERIFITHWHQHRMFRYKFENNYPMNLSLSRSLANS